APRPTSHRRAVVAGAVVLQPRLTIELTACPLASITKPRIGLTHDVAEAVVIDVILGVARPVRHITHRAEMIEQVPCNASGTFASEDLIDAIQVEAPGLKLVGTV